MGDRIKPARLAARDAIGAFGVGHVEIGEKLGHRGADLVGQGRLPNFKRLMSEGAFGPLRSQEPMLSPLLWTTIATGKWPTEHGVLDFMIADPDDPKKRVTVEGRNRQVEAIWDVVGRYGSKVGVVGWLATHPAEKVNGFAVSDRTEPLAYLLKQKPIASDEGKTWPAGLLQERVHVHPVRPVRRHPSRRGVGMEEIPLLFQVAHRVANGGRRDPQVEAPHHRATPRGLSGVHVGADHRLEDELLALRERVSDHASGQVWMSSEIWTDAVGPSIGSSASDRAPGLPIDQPTPS